ncbi:hypothetical protein [Dokdonella sp.]|uniref:hypothetical protein n=1 Tax=Dokdonella sp. TaxID=2291710 RepID=UPI001B0FB49E|nr:hypothetical protein [Dokdonella sp.]MBO9663261.1 hypothetical protein [Dokdonella sp.]
MRRFDTRVAIAIVLAVLAFVVAFGVDWRLPGLYMDAVNPEYLIPGILDPSAPGNRPWILPGNMVADRYPIFTGSIYHGSAQLYFALPWMMLFDAGVGSLRLVQGLVGVGILALLALFVARSTLGYTRWVAASAALLLALDPSFVMSLRTQAYSCLFPLPLLLGSLLLTDGRESRPSTWRLLAGGTLYGLSVFSYFIYAFFAPVVLWWIFRGTSRGEPWLRRAIVWLVGAAIGYAPFFAGLLLLRDNLGSWDALVGWLLNHGERMKVMGESSGAIEHLRAVLTDFGSVITGDWPHRMILQFHDGRAVGVIKAVTLAGVPILALALALRRTADARRSIGPPLLLTIVFLAVASLFGERLDGHHYTALQPLLYAAFGIAVATLIGSASGTPASAPKAGRWSLRAAIAFASVSIVACANAFDLTRFHVDLRASGGAQLYSDAIDRFAADMQQNDPDATVYLPDWGFVMPIMFMTRARLAQFEWVDPMRMRRELCEGKPQVVVFSRTGNGEKFHFIADLAGREPGPITTWTQRDGTPVFESMRLSPRECSTLHEDEQFGTAAAEASSASIEVSPSSVYTCSFLSPSIATVRWDAGGESGEEFDVWIGVESRPLKPWTQGAAHDERTTGQWAQAGMRFVLVDPRTKKEIVGARIQSLGCPVPESNTPS